MALKQALIFPSFTKDIGPFDKNNPGYADGKFKNSFTEPYVTEQVGATADYKVTDKLTIATELLLNGYGMEYDIKHDGIVLTDTAGNQSDAYDHYLYQLFYLELPILFRIDLPIHSNNAEYAVYVGVSPAIKILATANYNHYTTDDDGNVGATTDQQELNNVRNFQLNTVLGFWVGEKKSELNLPFTFFFDARLEYTNLPVFTVSQQNGSNYNTGMYNISLGMGIRF